MAGGIPFVPLDCQLDEKFDYIEADFGLMGFAVVVKLFQRIYGGHGYYCEWNNRVALLFAHKIGAGGDVVREIASAAMREGIFSKEMFEKYGVLTSRGIQKRFADVAKRRKEIFDKPEYVLLDYAQNSGDVDNSGENVCNSSKNVCNSETSKVKESKGKECKGKESRTAAPPASAPLPDRNSLVLKYGEHNVARYELKFQSWQQRKGISGGISYARIAEWLIADGVPEQAASSSSIDIDGVMEDLRRQYTEGQNED